MLSVHGQAAVPTVRAPLNAPDRDKPLYHRYFVVCACRVLNSSPTVNKYMLIPETTPPLTHPPHVRPPLHCRFGFSAMQTWMDDNELVRHEDYVARESVKREVARQEIKRTDEMAQRSRQDEQARREAEQAREREEREIVRREAERRTKEAEEDFVTAPQAAEMEESIAHPGASRVATSDVVMRQISFHVFVQS